MKTKLNRMMQDLHSPDGGAKWVEVQVVEMELCLFLHQLADYSYIMGDLYYGTVYQSRYWMLLYRMDLDDERRQFVRDGCLTLILAMCWEMIDGTGRSPEPYIPECRAAVSALSPNDARGTRLRQVVLSALDAAEEGAEPDSLMSESIWVHEVVIKEYFRSRTREFETNPYFTGTPGDPKRRES